MPHTYSQLYVHIVFAVKYRQSLINPNWQTDLYKYISGIIEYNNHKLHIINGVSDHIHILVGLNPANSLSTLVEKIKSNSSKWINTQRLTFWKFQWQEGYGAFSYSKSQLPTVVNYIKNQENHHKKQSFNDEYLRILKDFDIDYNQKYVLKSPE